MQPLLSTLMITTDNPCICISESLQYQCLLHKIRIIYYLLPIADILLGHSLSPGVGQLQGVAPPCQVCPWRRSASPPFHLPHTPRYGHRAHLWRTATWKKKNISNFSSFIVILTLTDFSKFLKSTCIVIKSPSVQVINRFILVFWIIQDYLSILRSITTCSYFNKK